MGTLVGLCLYLLPGVDNPFILFPMIVVGFVIGVSASARVAAVEGNRLTKSAELAKATFQKATHSTPDPSIVVIDEIVGMWIALLFVPKSLPAVLVAFVSFRVFDIIKPFPAARLESVPDGYGIMLDDVVAGIYANIATHLVLLGVQYLR